MKSLKSASILAIFFLPFPATCFSQKTDVETISLFGSRINEPITFEVKSDTSNIYFNVKNKSLLPYMVEIRFSECKNLSPQVFFKKETALPGPNRLFTFKIVDKYVSPALRYETKYYLAPTVYSGERFNQYIIPVGRSKTVKQNQLNRQGNRFLPDLIMNDGDTVFCARKGVVTAIPGTREEIDRIYNNSIEILHEDGSVAVYSGFEAEQTLISMGQKVYPCQPLCIVRDTCPLSFKVFEIQDEGKLVSFNVFYSVSAGKTVSEYSLNGIKVTYPEEVIIKEMTKREIAKYRRNTLF